MYDFQLRFDNEAQALSVLYDTEPSTKPVLVTDAALEAVLDSLPLADAETDQTVTNEGKTYMADAGKWFELVAYDKPVQARYDNIDVIGTIYREDGTQSDGYHVNVRTFEEAPELEAYRVYPVTPVRVWA